MAPFGYGPSLDVSNIKIDGRIRRRSSPSMAPRHTVHPVHKKAPDIAIWGERSTQRIIGGNSWAFTPGRNTRLGHQKTVRAVC